MDKKPVKVRLAEKHVSQVQESFGTLEMRAAYVAGFDRAKAMCVDAVQRFADEWVPDDGSGKKLSEHVATIGELP